MAAHPLSIGIQSGLTDQGGDRIVDVRLPNRRTTDDSARDGTDFLVGESPLLQCEQRHVACSGHPARVAGADEVRKTRQRSNMCHYGVHSRRYSHLTYCHPMNFMRISGFAGDVAIARRRAIGDRRRCPES